MVSEEVEVFQKLREEFDNGYIQKNTANKAKGFYNVANPDTQINYCMCIATKRMILAETMLEWYESQNR